MNHAVLVALLAGGVVAKGGRWADLGAGEGAFTLALADLLGPGAEVTAVDRDRRALRLLAAEMGRRFPETRLEVLVEDFTRPLGLRDLDGVVMANSLHFVRDKGPVLEAVKAMLRPSGRLIVVEYGADRGNPWVPHPFSFDTWKRLSLEAGFTYGVPAPNAREGAALLHTVPSRFLGSIYSAVSRRPET